MQAPKNGFFYVHRSHHRQADLGAKPFVAGELGQGDRPEDRPPGRGPRRALHETEASRALVMPGPFGAHNWQPMAFSPQTGLVYMPAQELALAYLTTRSSSPARSASTSASTSTAAMMPDDAKSRAAALATVQRLPQGVGSGDAEGSWSVEHSGAWNGGVLSTAGNLVFQGNVGGEFVAYNASDGTKLWSFPAQTGVIAAPATYTIGDEQYVVVLAGWGGAYAISGGDASRKGGPAINRSRVLAFKLGGTAHVARAGAGGGARETAGTRRGRAAGTSGTGRIPSELFDVSRRLGSRRRRAAGPALVADESHGASVARSRDRRREEGSRHGEFRAGDERRGCGSDPRLRHQARERHVRGDDGSQQVALVIWTVVPTLLGLLGGDRFRRGWRNPRCMPSCK